MNDIVKVRRLHIVLILIPDILLRLSLAINQTITRRFPKPEDVPKDTHYFQYAELKGTVDILLTSNEPDLLLYENHVEGK